MIGKDCNEVADLDEWVGLAKTFADLQQARILESLSAHVSAGSSGILVGAGTGRFVLPPLASRCGLAYRDIDTLLESRIATQGTFTLADCLPAYSVAELYRLEHACR